MAQGQVAPDVRILLVEFERKYMWWRPIGAERHSTERIIAQVMNLGSYDDIRRLEKVLEPKALGKIARHSAAGWLTSRSWEFWRGRLAAAGVRIPKDPPRRTFDAPSA